ncbi:MAG: 3-oxoacyl-[acyl-carrier-protein] synthase III C-terminal domain-containing protein [Microbacteriaceae bacterium]|nr:3-oxoacyl-[acyl-carrier-protein] synthase III C-terminal domain-containing protein [Microbacteriaceae bacterium]
MTRAHIVDVATWFPPTVRSTAEAEARLAAENPGMKIPTSLIGRMTGVEQVYVADDETQASDLAASAARALPGGYDDVDLLIFSSATQDLIEPATAHIVAAKLDLKVPVFDVKNACNSVLNALEIADAFIRAGMYQKILIVSGEKPSVATRWRLDRAEDFVRSFPGYTMGDAGAALVVAAGDDSAGIIGAGMLARSDNWRVGTVASGGTLDPSAEFGRWFDIDGVALHAVFKSIPKQPVQQLIARSGVDPRQAEFVAVHQVALPYLKFTRKMLGITAEQMILTLPDHGNIASVTLPRQIELARQQGRTRPGAEALLVGLAGGVSVGIMGVRW